MEFRHFIEDAEEVLSMIKKSPNFQKAQQSGNIPERFWDRYKKRWGVQGQFVERRFSVPYLLRLIEDNHLYLSQFDNREVKNKQETGKFNMVIIGKSDNQCPCPLAVLDGTHSLVAAIRSNQTEIPVIISEEALRYLGIQ